MKKVFQYATLLLAGMSLTACALLPTSNQDIPSKQSQEKKDKKAASNGQVEVKIKDGQFILPSNGLLTQNTWLCHWKLRIKRMKKS